MISVCMTTFNGEKYLRRQLDTILSQLGTEDELIISDDSSTDGTIEIIKSYSDSRIKLLENGNFGSPVFNMENALKRAQGDYLFLADQDDVWLPGRVQKVIEKLQQYDLVVCNAFIVDGNEKVIHESYFEWKGSSPGFFRNLRKNSFLGCSLAFSRKIVKAALPFPKQISMHDVWIGLMAECMGKVLFLDKRLMYYRRHDNNFTASVHKADNRLSDFSLSYKIRYRLLLLFYVMKRCLRKPAKQ
jgi:glycosyltransferase involved in cell wall biosynthesis